MVLRFLIKILANNEQLIQKLSESYPMRRAAQIIVRATFHGKHLIQESGLDQKLNAEQFRAAMHRFAVGLQKQLKEASDDLKSRMKK